MVMSRGGQFPIVVVKVKWGWLVVVVVVVEFRGMILFHIIRSTGTATVVICITMAIIIGFLVVAVILIIVQHFEMRGRVIERYSS